jgi:hypothetical protein
MTPAQLANVFLTLSHLKSIRIFSVLRARFPDSTTPTQMSIELDLPVNETSRFMLRMADAGLLLRMASGKHSFYTVNPSAIQAIGEYFWIGTNESTT